MTERVSSYMPVSAGNILHGGNQHDNQRRMPCSRIDRRNELRCIRRSAGASRWHFGASERRAAGALPLPPLPRPLPPRAELDIRFLGPLALCRPQQQQSAHASVLRPTPSRGSDRQAARREVYRCWLSAEARVCFRHSLQSFLKDRLFSEACTKSNLAEKAG